MDDCTVVFAVSASRMARRTRGKRDRRGQHLRKDAHMKIRPGYTIRQILDMYVIIGIGAETYDPNVIMSLNETGAFLWGVMQDGADEATLIRRLREEFSVDQATAAHDVSLFLDQLRQRALIEE